MALEGIWEYTQGAYESRGAPREVFISTKGIYFCSLSKQQQLQLTMVIARLALCTRNIMCYVSNITVYY